MTFFGKKRFWLFAICVLVLFTFLVTAVVFYFERQNDLPFKYEEFVYESASAYDVPPEVVFAVIYAESSFREQALSSQGAMGLMQLMPATYDELCRKLGIDAEEVSPFDPAVNIRCGTYYLHELYLSFGRWDMAIAAYNAGIGRVHTWLSSNVYADGNGGLSVIPYPETAAYLDRVLEVIPIYRDMIEKQNNSQ